MKRKFLFLGCLLGSALLLASCGKDEVDETWKTLPQEEIAIENGKARLIRARESFEDLIRLEKGLI